LSFVVVIPTYNEAENLPTMVSALFSLPLDDLHILVVDDHSPDGTGALAESLKAETGRVDVIHREGKLGLGSAYIAGFKKAIAEGAQLIGQMDCDFSHPPEKLIELKQAILAGADLALGSRYIPGGSLDEKWPFWRKALSGFGNFYARTILAIPIRDVTGGFRVWKREMLSAMPLDDIRSNGYVFQVEMLYVASILDCQVTEIPIYFADRRFGQSKMSFRIQVEAALRVWRLLGMHKKIQRMEKKI
jgi:dolichol-phosphate mannosyltransferase